MINATVTVKRTWDGNPYVEANCQSAAMCDYLDTLPAEFGVQYRSDYRENPEWIGITVYPKTDEMAKTISEKLKTFFPDIEKYFIDEAERDESLRRDEQERFEKNEEKIRTYEHEHPDRVVLIDRRTRLGWGYNTSPTGHGTEIASTNSPDIVGTVKTIVRKRGDDRAYQSMRNCYKTTAWFVRMRKQWRKITWMETDIDELTMKSEDGFITNTVKCHIA